MHEVRAGMDDWDRCMAHHIIRTGSALDRDVFDDDDREQVEAMADGLAREVLALLDVLGGRALLAVVDRDELDGVCLAAISSAYERGHAASEHREFLRSRAETGSVLSTILGAALDAANGDLDAGMQDREQP